MGWEDNARKIYKNKDFSIASKVELLMIMVKSCETAEKFMKVWKEAAEKYTPFIPPPDSEDFIKVMLEYMKTELGIFPDDIKKMTVEGFYHSIIEHRKDAQSGRKSRVKGIPGSKKPRYSVRAKWKEYQIYVNALREKRQLDNDSKIIKAAADYFKVHRDTIKAHTRVPPAKT